MKYRICLPWNGSLCGLRALARNLANSFGGHPTQVSMQVQLATTCQSVWPGFKILFIQILTSRFSRIFFLWTFTAKVSNPRMFYLIKFGYCGNWITSWITRYSGFQLKLRPHCSGGMWKRRFHPENASKVFRPHYAGENLKTQQSPVILNLCLGKPSRHRFRKAPFSNSSGLKSIFKESRDGLVWTVGQTVKIKLQFLIYLA